MTIKHTRDNLSPVYHQSLSIRHAVFVKEQQVPLTLEIDQNEAYCIHFVLYDDADTPVATLRILPDKSDKQALIQRVATLKPYRGKGYAFDLMTEALAFLKAQQIELAELHAQLEAIPFYEKLGFTSFGDEFLDADIKHLAMKKTV